MSSSLKGELENCLLGCSFRGSFLFPDGGFFCDPAGCFTVPEADVEDWQILLSDRTIKGALEFPPTREIADACFKEVLAVAKAKGYDLGDDYLKQALGYLEKVGVHKDSMCFDIANRTRTEIDFLGGKVVAYGREKGVPTPFYLAMTNLVKALEDNYLSK